jgi:hypothetical protein
MYSDDGNLSQSYFIAMMDMRNLILKESDKHDVVTDEHSKRIFGGNSSLLNAIDAYVSLKYFDDMLNEFLGKSIKVMKNYKNQELPLNY